MITEVHTIFRIRNLFGGWPDEEVAQYDILASGERFRQELKDSLRIAFPEAKITVETIEHGETPIGFGAETYIAMDVTGKPELYEAAQDTIDDLYTFIYESLDHPRYSWLVPQPPSR